MVGCFLVLVLCHLSRLSAMEKIVNQPIDELVLIQKKKPADLETEKKATNSGKSKPTGGMESLQAMQVKVETLAQKVAGHNYSMTDSETEALNMIKSWIERMHLTLNQQHDEDQHEIHLVRDALVGCTDAASEELDVVEGHKTAAEQNRQSHEVCRQGEVTNKQNQTTRCQDYTAYRKTSPDRTPPDCLQTKLTLDYIQSSDEDMTQAMESCLEDTQPWFIPLHEKYLLCKEAKEITANRTRECNAKQGTFEQAFCAYAAKLKDTCEEQESCFNNLLPQRQTTHEEVSVSEVARKSEFLTGQKMLCLFKVFDANNTDKSTTLSTCENTTFNASNYTIVYFPAPSPVTCNEEPHQPCDVQFLQDEYQGKGWSTDAPATTCHSCPAPVTTTTTTTEASTGSCRRCSIHFPGQNTAAYAQVSPYDFPGDSDFSVEGWIKVTASSGGRFIFSYAVNHDDNCLLVKADIGNDNTWVHWAMNVAPDKSITHYIDGSLRNEMRYSSSFCGTNHGSLVLAQDQDGLGGNFDANQAPEMWYDSLRVYQGQLSSTEIQELASKTKCVARQAWSNWVFSRTTTTGNDHTPQDQSFSRYGPVPTEDGLIACEAPVTTTTTATTTAEASDQGGCAALLDGGGWNLVRHMPGQGRWIACNDNLEGTCTLGTPAGPNAETYWTVTWTAQPTTEVLFAFGDCSMWLVTTMDAVNGEYYANAERQVLRSSVNSAPHTRKWYNRMGNSVDPWISVYDHGVSDSIVYGEAFSADHFHAKNEHGGANVYLREVPPV